MQKAKRIWLKVNQKKDGFIMWCPIYAAAINLAWNTWITLNKQQISEIIDICRKKWFWTDKWGGWIKSCMTEVFNYVIKANPWLSYSVFDKKSPAVKLYLSQWYMLWCWIAVNNKFLEDKRDNNIVDAVDYSVLAGSWYKHCTNLVKGIWLLEKFKHFVFDSYYWTKDNLYQVNLKEMVEDILQNTVYFFYLK